MHLSDFDFELPDELIALRPVRPRTSARLLLEDSGVLSDRSVEDLPSILQPNDRLILNDTKVIPARLFGVRPRESDGIQTQAKMEVTLLSPQADGSWSALIKPLKKVREGEDIIFSEALSARVLRKDSGQAYVVFNMKGDDFDAALLEAGSMPLPPYIAAKRAADQQDHDDYQTCWAEHKGAVAAPTASLHFDDALLEQLRAKGVQMSYVTLHVGAGTFLPVKDDNIDTHKMHAEWGYVSEQVVEEVARTKRDGGRVIAVGTTALRLIESAARSGPLLPWRGETDIFIKPGFEFHVADGLMTNFHLPKSTLMILISALIGQERVREIYQHAIENKYRFFSYGDSSLLFPHLKSKNDTL